MMFLWFLLGTPPSQTNQCAHCSFMEGVLHGQVSLLPLWNASLLDKSLGTQVLLRPVNKLCVTVLDAPQCFLGKVLLSSAIAYIKTQSVVFCCCAVRQSAGYQEVDHLLAVSQQKHVASQFTFKSDIVSLTTGCWCSHCRGSTSAKWSLEVSIYCGPDIGCHFLVMGFPLSLTRRAQALGPWGYKTLGLWID